MRVRQATQDDIEYLNDFIKELVKWKIILKLNIKDFPTLIFKKGVCMFWKNYKTIIPAILGIVPVVSNALGFPITAQISADITGLALFFIGLMAKDFDK
jgi:hypothetical protein